MYDIHVMYLRAGRNNCDGNRAVTNFTVLSNPVVDLSITIVTSSSCLKTITLHETKHKHTWVLISRNNNIIIFGALDPGLNPSKFTSKLYACTNNANSDLCL